MCSPGDLRGENDKAKVYEYYVNRQQAIYALDFDDLLLYTVRMFRQFAEIQAKWVRVSIISHVDEFQDIDKIQYDLIQLLAGNDNSVYVVGDPDQTIYTWRGADVNIIQNFEKDYQPCETIVLKKTTVDPKHPERRQRADSQQSQPCGKGSIYQPAGQRRDHALFQRRGRI